MKLTGISVFSHEPTEIYIDNGKIKNISSATASLDLPYIAPGFIDLQVNGYKGSDYSADTLREKDIEKIVNCLVRSEKER